MEPAIIVHGGAGSLAPERFASAQAGCAAAVSIGMHVLRAGGSALAAVIAATVAMEDYPMFNAGTGAVLNADGFAELDAGLMDGATLDVGAAIGLRRVRNPIRLAEHILASEQVLLAGAGAEDVAASAGLELVDPAYFVNAHQQRHLGVVGGGEGLNITNPVSAPDVLHGTVGAVAIDARGHTAAASSTGGYDGKPVGRVGDSPLAGAGFYAEDGAGAVSCTGMGEFFIRLALARRATEWLGNGDNASTVAQRSIALLGTRLQGAGGLIVVDRTGQVGWARNTAAMPHALQQGTMAAPQSGI